MNAELKLVMVEVTKIIASPINITSPVSGMMKFITYYMATVIIVIENAQNVERKLKMKVKQLYEFLKNNLDSGAIKEDTDVIIVGEYNYGDSLGKPYIDKMSLIDEEEIVKEDVTVVALSNGGYLYESEDLGCCRMWIDNQTLDELKEEWGKEE